nr:MAG TPA: hypothetical protein [Caudoviricetes sp.]
MQHQTSTERGGRNNPWGQRPRALNPPKGQHKPQGLSLATPERGRRVTREPGTARNGGPGAKSGIPTIVVGCNRVSRHGVVPPPASGASAGEHQSPDSRR